MEDVVKRRPRIHPSHLVSAVSQKNHQRRKQRRDLPRHCDFYGFYCTQAIVGKGQDEVGKGFRGQPPGADH
jgi:hypothetical protein